MNWTDEANEKMERIPIFVRPMVKMKVEKKAKEDGVEEITAEYLDKVKEELGG